MPYIVFENNDDATTKGGEALAGRLLQCLAELCEKYSLLAILPSSRKSGAQGDPRSPDIKGKA